MNKCLDNSLKQGQQKWEGDKERERDQDTCVTRVTNKHLSQNGYHKHTSQRTLASLRSDTQRYVTSMRHKHVSHE